VFGLLDYNIDRIAEVSREAERRGVPLESVVAELYELRTRGGPTVSTTLAAAAEERSVAS